MRYPVIILLWVLPFLGQSATISSWKNALSNSKVSDKKKLFYADSLLLHYRKTSPDSALYFAHQLKKYALLIKDTASVDYANNHLGSIHRIKGNFDSSVFYYYEALKSYQQRKFEDGVASVYNNLATVYKTQGRYDLAIKNYLEALEIFKHTTRFTARANLYSNFAGLYFKLENYEKAKKYWQLAEIDFQKENSSDITFTYRGMSKVSIISKKYDNAIIELNKALETDIKNGVKVAQAEDYVLLMEVALKQKNFYAFNSYLNKIRPLLSEANIPLLQSKYFELLADYNFYNNNYKESLVLYDSSLAYLANEDVPEIYLSVYKKLFDSKIMVKDFNGIEKDFAMLNGLSEEVTRLRQDRITQEADARFSLREKEEKIRLLDEMNKANEELVEKERQLGRQRKNQILLLWIAIVVVVAFVIYYLFTNKKLKKTQKELVKTIDEKEVLFKELNHRVKNNLHIVSSFLSIESFDKPDEVKQILSTCENRIHSLGLVHEMLYKNEWSEYINVPDYFNKLAEVINQTLGNNETEFRVTIDPEIQLNSQKTVLVGLITNEILTNSLKHGKVAGEKMMLDITLNKINDHAELVVKDNGNGKKNESGKDSIGIKLIKGLTNQLGGKLEEMNLEKGTGYKILFSL